MLAFFIALTLLIIDQLSKIIILQYLQPQQSLPLIKNIFHLSLVCNRGIAFGIFSKCGSIFIWISVVAVVIICFIFTFHKKTLRQRKSTQIFLALILAGAVGNLIDRLRFGFVIDFLDFRIWPVFNIADAAITVGTALLIFQMLRGKNVSRTS